MEKLDIKCIVSAEQTNGMVAVFEEVVGPGIGPPRHTHRAQLEIFHIIEGTFKFEVDGKISEFSTGDTAVVSVGSVHAFRNVGSEPAKIHFEMLPAGHSEEAFDRLAKGEIGDPEEFFNKYEMDLVGPPLE
jgi:quercetin dioxygenase-like cupin family protein